MVLSGEAKRRHNKLYHQKNKEKIHQRKKKNYQEKKRKEAEELDKIKLNFWNMLFNKK